MSGIVDLADERLRRDVEHRLGPRALYEFLVEFGREQMLCTEIERRLPKYAALDPAILQALGGDLFPPRGNR